MKWDDKLNDKITIKKNPNAGLEENYCRNPDGSQQIWCYVKTKTLGGVEGIAKQYCKPRTEKCDYCYNKSQVKAHNKKRSDHKSKDLKFEIDSCIGVQKYLDGLTKDDKKPPASKAADRPKAMKDCGENIFKLPKDSKKGPTKDTDVATNTWYETRKWYDHENDKPKDSASA